MKKKIFLTGGSGFIGKNIKEFLSDKFDILAPSHSDFDYKDSSRLREFIKKNKIQIILHCANAGGGRDSRNYKNVVEVNLRIFINLVLCEDLIEKFIYFGSGAEYDKSRALVNISEKEFGKRVPKDDYGFYKFVCSSFALKSEKIYCLRLFGVYGKYENYLFKFISNSIVKNLLKQEIKIGQNVVFDYLYIDDLVKIVSYFINHEPKYKVYNIGSGGKTDLVEIAELINSASDYGSDINILHKGMNLEYTADISRLKKEIPDFKPISLAEGIRSLYNWYKKNLGMIDKEMVIKDPYLGKIKIKEQ